MAIGGIESHANHKLSTPSEDIQVTSPLLDGFKSFQSKDSSPSEIIGVKVKVELNVFFISILTSQVSSQQTLLMVNKLSMLL